VGDEEVEDPDEVYTRYLELEAQRSVLEKGLPEVQRARAMLEALEDPEKLLPHLPKEKARLLASKVAQQWMEEQEEKTLPPEERERRELRRKLEAYEREKQEAADAKQREEDERANFENAKRLHGELVEAIDRTGLPKTDDLYRRVVERMQANKRVGLDYPPAVVAKQVRAEWEKSTSEALATMPLNRLLKLRPDLVDLFNGVEDDGLLERLAPLTERARQRAIAKANALPAHSAPPSINGGPGRGSDEPDLSDPRAAEKWLRSRLRG
jgi:hypothetical protein